ncbi:MAG TPA: ABC transporter permease [Verrucomicrobiae bacterium]|jgi:ABC-2 type transport system permease protein|nr:ABC transporter permease [Verrucomicrobiae bacterium]
MHFLNLLRNEVTKLTRHILLYFSLFAAGLVCVIIYFVGGQLSDSATTNAWGYVAFSMQMVFTDIGPVLVISVAARLVALETRGGTIRSLLAAPVYRWEIYAAKAVTGLLYMIVFSATTLLISALLARIHYHFGAVSDAYGVVYNPTQVFHAFLIGYALSWVPLVALVMYGILISTVFKNVGTATSVGITSLFLIDFTKHLIGLDPFVFTRDINYSWLTLQQMTQGMDYAWRPEVWRMITLSGVSAIIAFGIGLVIFVREDLNH